jgi:hypothetical protein
MINRYVPEMSGRDANHIQFSVLDVVNGDSRIGRDTV